jgi:class 3 adenylate cyclase
LTAHRVTTMQAFRDLFSDEVLLPGENMAIDSVTLNGRLDYFGSTVNLAARLQGLSEGGDIVLSESLAADPAVRRILEPYRASHESASLKGFDRPARFARLTMR